MDKQNNTNITALRELQEWAHETSRNNGFWDTYQEFYDTPEVLHRFVATQLALIADEAHEALRVLRSFPLDMETAERGDYASRIPDEFGEELADIVIRTLDLAGGLAIALPEHVVHKIEKNRGRPRMHNKNF